MNKPNKIMPQKTKAIDKLKVTYLHWTNKQLEQLHAYLHQFNANDVMAAKIISGEIFELAHNIKGLGGSFGYYLMTDVAVSLCEYLRYAEDMAVIEEPIIVAHVQAMDAIISEELEGSGGEEGQRIMAQLQKTIIKNSSC